MNTGMRQNPELLAVVAFGAASVLGLAGAGMWMALAVGAIYGLERLTVLASNAPMPVPDHHHSIQHVGAFASRLGAILATYGATLALRSVGTAWQ
jgi:hypothetical protein